MSLSNPVAAPRHRRRPGRMSRRSASGWASRKIGSPETVERSITRAQAR
jgi:hypothetical protein